MALNWAQLAKHIEGVLIFYYYGSREAEQWTFCKVKWNLYKRPTEMLEPQSTKIIFPKCFVVIEPIIYITNFNVGLDNFSWIRVWEYLEISMILSKYLKNDTERVGCV